MSLLDTNTPLIRRVGATEHIHEYSLSHYSKVQYKMQFHLITHYYNIIKLI